MKFFVATTAAAALALAAARTETEYVGPSTKIVANSSEVPPHYPWASVEDFFTQSGVDKDELEVTGRLLCNADSPKEKVYQISDGTQERCFVTYTPTSGATDGPKPVLYFAHGSGGNAAHCGEAKSDQQGNTWLDVADKYGFVFICGEALQYEAINNATNQPLHGGLWEIPEVFTDNSGAKCDTSDSFDNQYMKNLVAQLAKEPEQFDTSRFFVTGCSMGSAFTIWQSPCLHQLDNVNVSAFSSHSTGLKKKGDGLRFPPDTYNPQYSWGECPECQYWPTTVQENQGLKACVFDNTADPNEQEPTFYTSSKQFVTAWNAKGNRQAETHWGTGGHCDIHSYIDIATCLDDGTGRLIGK
eukprot:CAMPEP_0195520600 /NCGR_PEP_ID=MMETSP0794_2-20130614/17241_1 /TAXON_ID=515487 /ORGANISM="Stephanopyxis turris, Strain CCMP 815" /LENGTH=356 /DNA_ID=CAMNT_0040649989 /DNA_START=66 /DNA_END=1136 /DNA_ORIENTATION=+